MDGEARARILLDVDLRVWAFARGIVGTSEYRALMDASAEFERDQEAQALVEAYLARMAEIRRTGADPASSDDLAAFEVEVGRNGTLMALLDAEAAFTALLRASNDRISERIGRPFLLAGERDR